MTETNQNLKYLIGLGVGIVMFIIIIMVVPIMGSSIDSAATTECQFTITLGEVSDGDAVSIAGTNTEIYEFDNNDNVTAGYIRITPAPTS